MRSFGWLTGVCLLSLWAGRGLLSAQNRPLESVGIAEGNQIFVARCGGCHGADARGSDRGPALAEVRRLRTRSVQQLRDIIQKGIPGTGMPPFDLPAAEVDALAALVRSLNGPAAESVVSGDVAAGEQYFFGRGQCASCWPIDDWWNFHAGGGEFKDIHVYSDALTARYGKADTLEDYVLKAQLMNYEGIRAMFEAYSHNKYTSTGVIQWMLNNAWPSMIWHLYDYYLRPGGGYFGAKRAMESLHPMYAYDDRSVWVVSSRYEDVKGLKLTAKAYNLDMAEKFSQETAVDAAADSTNKILTLPAVPDASPVYFLVLRLEDSSGKLVGSNFYWLSSKQETLDWEKSNWFTTPTSQFADYTALSQLPKVSLKTSSRTERAGEESVTHVTIENPNKTLAFFVRLKVNKGAGGEEILPVVWEDNYFSLLPGEQREVSASYRTTALGNSKPVVEVSGWNVH